MLRHIDVEYLYVWEPAAGSHMMSDVINQKAMLTITSDKFTYDKKHDFEFDFYGKDTPPIGHQYDAIITNPPYGKRNAGAVKFAERALEMTEKTGGTVALLLTAKFDFGKTRKHLFADNPRFHAKINLVDRISWEGNGKTGTEDHAWYIWGAPAKRLPVLLYEGNTAT